MNLYAYVGNDPVNKNDPFGLCVTGPGTRICDKAATEAKEKKKEERDKRREIGEQIRENGKAQIQATRRELGPKQSQQAESAGYFDALNSYVDASADHYIETGEGLGPLSYAAFIGPAVGKEAVLAIGFAVLAEGRLVAAGGKATGRFLTTNSVTGKYGSVFGRGGSAAGGVLNSNKYLRIGYGWDATRAGGSDVFRVAWGKSGASGAGHFNLYTFKNLIPGK